MPTMRTSSCLLVTVALVLTGCGNEPSTSVTGDGDAVTVSTADTTAGEVLVDGQGMTLYLFDDDPEGESACTGGCAETWPPLHGTPTAGSGADPDLLGTIERPDGTTQTTYGGHPVYLYAPDHAPGDITGQGVGEVWWVVAPDGTAIRASGTEGAATDPDGATTSPPPATPAY